MSFENERRTQMGNLIVCGRVFPVYKGLNLIGRSPTATVILKNENVSQHHAIITIIDENQHFLSDVSSSNGTVLEKNKLEPLHIYELKQDNVIEFANVVAVYKKVLNELDDISTNDHSDIGNLQSTQNVDDTFYLANTQTLNEISVPPISEAHHNGYFDDGYDFNNLPSPPSTSISFPRKLDIHEMPTQLYGVVNINDIENEVEIAHTSRHSIIHELPTQLITVEVASTSADDSTQEVAVNDKNTPLQKEEIQQNSTDQLSIHFKPTQLLYQIENEDVDDIVVPQTQDSPAPNHSRLNEHLDSSVDVIDQTGINDSGVDDCSSKVQFQSNGSPTLINATPCKITVNNVHLENSSKNTTLSTETPESQEIGQLKKKCLPLESDSENELESRTLQGKISQSQDIGHKRKLPRKIDSDSDTEVEDLEILAAKAVRKRKHKIYSDSDKEKEGKNSIKKPTQNSFIEVKAQEAKSHDTSSKIYLDSDIRDEGNKDSIKNFSCKSKPQDANKKDESLKIDSDSETDMEVENDTKLENKSNDSSGSETDIDIEISDIKDVSAELPVNNTEYTSDLLENNQKTKASSNTKSENYEDINEGTKLNRVSNDETFFIPATQCSDDDSNDFNFMPENNSSRTSDIKVSVDNTEGSILDVSQKLYELRQRSIPQQNCSEESIHFGLTDTENTEDVANKSNDFKATNSTIAEINVSIKEKQMNIHEVGEELQQGNKLNTDITVQDKSATGEIKDDNLSNRNIIENNSDIFLQPTQVLSSDEHIPNEKLQQADVGIFEEPTQRLDLSQLNKTALYNNVNDIYLQSTQKLQNEDMKDCEKKDLADATLKEDDGIIQTKAEVSREVSSDAKLQKDDYNEFLKPGDLFRKSSNTSKLINNDNICMQPTQQLVLNSTEKSSSCIENVDDIFLQPTQAISEIQIDNDEVPFQPVTVDIAQNSCASSARRNTNELPETIMVNDKDEDNIFLQSTQILITEHSSPLTDNKTSTTAKLVNEQIKTNAEDDIFLQPTQCIYEEVQKVVSFNKPENVKSDNDDVPNDIFLQPTQVVEFDRSIRPLSLSLLRQPSEEIDKNDDAESQLEVSFTSQTVKLCSEINTRPPNPLVNELEKLEEEELPQSNKSTPDEDFSNFGNMEIYPTLEMSPIDDLDEFQKNTKLVVKNLATENREQIKSALKNTDSFLGNSKDFKSVTSTPIVKAKEQNNSRKGRNLRKRLNVDETKNSSELSACNQDLGVLDDDHRGLITKDVEKTNEACITNNSLSGTLSSSNDILHTQTKRKPRGRPKRGRKGCEGNAEPNVIEIVTDSRETMKNKLNAKDAESSSSKTKRGKFEHVAVLETNITLRNKDRKFNLDHETELKNASLADKDQNKHVASLNKCKPTGKTASDISIITISSTESPDVEEADNVLPTPNKRKKLNATASTTKLVSKKVNNKGVTKKPLIEDNEENETPPSTRRRHEIKTVETKNTVQVISTPERQKRQQKPKVVFTMLDSPELESLIRRLGGSVVDTVKSCTVLVTGSLKRSQKLLSAVGEAKPICGPKWLHASKAAGTFLDPWEYLLIDTDAEAKWNFSLKESLNRSSKHKLLSEHLFHIVTTNSTDVLKAAIESCGGKLVAKVPAKMPQNIIVIATPENRTKYLKFLRHEPPLKVVAPEAVFDGVLRQELHWDDHLLS